MPTRFQTYRKDVKLLPGQTLRFQKGKGYYAGPGAAPAPYAGGGPAEPKSGGGGNPYAPTTVVRVPKTRPGGPTASTPPPPVDPYAALSQAAIDKRAGELAQAGIDPQLDEVRRQQALAAQQATADEAAIQGFQKAAGELMGQIPGAISQAYDAAGNVIGDIGSGVGGQIGADLAQKQAADQAFAESQGQSGGTTSNGQVGDVLSYLGGAVPGTSVAEQGAAQAAAAAANVAIPLNAGREELDARMAQARQDNDQYAQQLIKIAAQFPDLKAQALQQLNQYEIDKANYRETRRVNTANIAAQKADTARQDRAEIANEQAAGIDATQKKAELAYKWANLQFQSQKALAAAKAAAAKGKRIDTAASRLLGHIVYQDGTEDKSIKVKQTGSGSSSTDPRIKAQYNRAKAVQTARQTAFKTAKTTLGKPTAVATKDAAAARALGRQVGKYIADPSQKYGVPGGVFPPAYAGAPATTNDPSRAVRTGGATNYAQAQDQVWQSIAGDSLMARFALSREQVMAYVNAALKAAGWKR